MDPGPRSPRSALAAGSTPRRAPRPRQTCWIPEIVPLLGWVRILTSLVSMNFAVEKLISMLLDLSAVIWKGEISLTSLYLHFYNCETLDMVGSSIIAKVSAS